MFIETIDGIFKEINTYHVDHTIAPQTILLSVISLGGGASLGPEQALVRNVTTKQRLAWGDCVCD